MGRPQKDHLTPATDDEIAKAQRTLDGWRLIIAYHDDFSAPFSSDEGFTEQDREPQTKLRRADLDALNVAISRSARPASPDKVLDTFGDIATARSLPDRLTLMGSVVKRIRRTGEAYATLPEWYKRRARVVVIPRVLGVLDQEGLDKKLADVLDAEDIREAIQSAPSKGTRAAVAALYGISVSALEKDLKRLREAARNDSK